MFDQHPFIAFSRYSVLRHSVLHIPGAAVANADGFFG